MPAASIRQRIWIRQSFMLPEDKITEADIKRRLLSTAGFKFTDTTLGGNFVINAPPSYCRYADPRYGGRQDSLELAWMRSTAGFQTVDDKAVNGFTSASEGMGAYYSEAIDDNNQIVVMRFGVPAFNSLTQFFGNFYHPEASSFARTARLSDNIIASILNKAAGAAGTVLGAMLALPFQPIILLMALWRKMSFSPPSKYYYLKPAMFSYWSAVQTIVNGIGVNLGLTPYQLTPGQLSVYGDNPAQFSGNAIKQYSQFMKDIITPDGYIDVYAMATKAQRRANKFQSQLQSQLETVTDVRNLAAAIRTARNSVNTDERLGQFKTFAGYLQAVAGEPYYKQGSSGATVNNGTGQDVVTDGAAEGGGGAQHVVTTDEMEPIGDRSNYDFGTKLSELWMGEMRDGAAFVSFRVDYTGSHSESFSNQTGESGISQKINSTSASARSARFDFADGNLAPGLGAVLEAGRSLVTNLLDQVQLSGLAALFGSAFVDIPEIWERSTAQLPTANFTMELRSPYANKLSQMQNLFIPLAMILAGALPIAAGKRAYTSPFICELYCKGRVNIRLGIIDSITIERGVGNTGWNQDGSLLGINVSFSVKDLSTVMSVPVTTQFSALDKAIAGAGEVVEALGVPGGNAAELITKGIAKGMYDDDNTFTDYLATLGSLSFSDMIYAGRQWRINRMLLHKEITRMQSAAMWSSFLGGMLPGRIWNAIALETDRNATGGL